VWLAPPTVTLILTLEGSITEGSALDLVCRAGVGGHIYSWLKDGSSLEVDNPEYSIGGGELLSVLSVRDVLPGVHDGLYTCRLDSQLVNGTRPSATVAVTIIGEPVMAYHIPRVI